MTLTPGTRLGPYEVTAQIGVGGMGEVYKATDTNLKRAVAIKVLPASVAADAERLARFQREAEVLAALNHPNIAAIYGLERSGATTALVLELVEGPTLADRIAEGAIPIDEALPIAKQIAEALEAAHEQGIIHRDLKPANVKVRPDGTVKVLDFGLAKAMEPDGAASPGMSQSPTITTPAMTQAGMILGTAAYMSPEQAKGRQADKRSDIWAFGCVLYEVLTGTRAFGGDDVSDTLAAVLRAEPDWFHLPSDTPAPIRRLLRRCLAKDRKERVPDIAVARLEIQEAQTAAGESVPTGPVSQPHKWQQPIPLLVAGAALVAMTGVGVWLAMRPPPAKPPQVTRFTVTPPATAPLVAGGTDRDVLISSDGTRVVYTAAGGQLFIRSLDRLDVTELQGLGPNARDPFISPDGRWVGFFTGTRPVELKKVSISGGPPMALYQFNAGSRGASWGPDDTIIFATNDLSTGLLQVPAAGGEPKVLTTPDAKQGEEDHAWPEILPGGQAVLFTILPRGGPIDNAQVAVLDLKSGERKILVRGGGHAQHARTGHLVYGVAGMLRAVAFDLERLEVLGDPVPVLDRVQTTGTGAANFDVSEEGTLVYKPGEARRMSDARSLVWVDRQGREEAVAAPPRAYGHLRLSPDGTRVALDVRDQEDDIWIWDLRRATLTRFTLDPAVDQLPVWAPDGRRLAFQSFRTTPPSIFWQAADGTGSIERLTESANLQAPISFSRDGTRLVIREAAPKTGSDLHMLVMDGKRQSQPLVHTTFSEPNADVSPDGRWLTYQSNESGRDEIYVRPFPDVSGGRWQISTGGGREPLWARNGQEVFYRAPDGALMGVPIARAASFTAGTVTKLFEGRYYAGGIANQGHTYDVSPDGRRFLMIKPGGGSDQTATPASLIVVQNWHEELKRLVPVN